VTHTECCIHTPLTRTCMLSTLAAARTPTPQHRGQQQPSHQAELEEKKRQLQAIKERRERRTRERASKVRVCVVCLDCCCCFLLLLSRTFLAVLLLAQVHSSQHHHAHLPTTAHSPPIGCASRTLRRLEAPHQRMRSKPSRGLSSRRSTGRGSCR
jgi:hypothetical protein